MAHHSVRVRARVAPKTKTADGATPRDGGDASHLRPLSEAVLKVSGLHGGIDAHGNVRDMRGLNDGAEDLDPFELPSDELHVHLARAAASHRGLISRDVNADGSVMLRMVYGDGDVVTGKGADTRAAAQQLLKKAGGLK